MSGEQIAELKTTVIGVCGGLLGILNKPILNFILSFRKISEFAELYSTVTGAIVVTLTGVYMIQKILGKRK